MNNYSLSSNDIALLEDTGLVDQNLIGMYKYFGIKKIKVQSANYYLLNTRCRDALWNMICLPDKLDYGVISNIENVFKKQKVPFSWWVDEKKISNDMRNLFQNKEYADFGCVPGMILNLADYPSKSVPSIGNIYIKPITNIKEYDCWIQVLAECFGFSNDVCNLYMDKLSSTLGKDNTFIPFGAYDGEKIVATASIIFVDGIAGFYNDSTLPQYRNSGIATTLYHTRAKMLKKLGVQKAVIQTSPMATNIARQFGFRIVTNYKIYYTSN
jgi:hypothetical protein